MPVATDTSDFESSDAWEMLEESLVNFADAYEVDEDVLVLSVQEMISSIIKEREEF